MFRQLVKVSLPGFLPVLVSRESSEEPAPPGEGRFPAEGGTWSWPGRTSVDPPGCVPARGCKTAGGGGDGFAPGKLVVGGRVSRLRCDWVAGAGVEEGGGVAVVGAPPPPVGPPVDGDDVCATAAPAQVIARATITSNRIKSPRASLAGNVRHMGNVGANGNVPPTLGIDGLAELW